MLALTPSWVVLVLQYHKVRLRAPLEILKVKLSCLLLPCMPQYCNYSGLDSLIMGVQGEEKLTLGNCISPSGDFRETCVSCSHKWPAASLERQVVRTTKKTIHCNAMPFYQLKQLLCSLCSLLSNLGCIPTSRPIQLWFCPLQSPAFNQTLRQQQGLIMASNHWQATQICIQFKPTDGAESARSGNQ